MPSFIRFLLMLLLVANSLIPVYAGEVKKVVFHINNPTKVDALAESVTNLNRVSPDADVVVIFNGRGVVAVSMLAPQKNAVEEILSTGARIGACTTAMLQLAVPTDALIKGVEYIHEGGVLRLIKLQEQGYSYIKM